MGLRLVIAIALVAGIAPRDARADEVPFAWSAMVEVGASFALLDGTALGDQMKAFGYELSAPGFRGTLAVDRKVLDWLRVGGSLSVDTFTAERARDASETRLTRVTWLAYVEPLLCLSTSCRGDDGMFFGLRVAVGAGPTFWALRGETETGAHIMLEPSLVWDIEGDHWGLGVRLGHAFAAQSGLGPMDVGTGFTWMPSIQAQVMVRW